MMEPCPECGVPEYITEEHRWLDNGDIVQKKDEKHRMLFIETENFDPLIRSVEEIIGTSIEHIVITAMRRAAHMYIEFVLPPDLPDRVREGELSPQLIDEVIANIGRMMGFGNYQFVDMRYEQDMNDFFTVSVTEPYSLPMCAAGHAAAMEAIFGYGHDVTYEEVSPGHYNMTTYPSKHPEVLKERFVLQPYNPGKGDIELEKCGTCGSPAALSDFAWLIERGIILNKYDQRRMALIGPHELEPVFRELEEELGDTVPRAVVEAQRRFSRSGFYDPEMILDADDLRIQFALRGLGNLRSLEAGKQGLNMLLDNSLLHLLIVGMMQGVYENAYDVQSTVNWELSGDSLKVKVTPG
jgi:hypothetical protein